MIAGPASSSTRPRRAVPAPADRAGSRRRTADALELLIDDGRRRGLTPEAARTEALRAIGGVEQIKEAVRDRRGFRGLETLRAERPLQRALARAARRASPSPPSSRSRSASAPTPRSSASSTRRSCGRCPTRIPAAWSSIWEVMPSGTAASSPRPTTWTTGAPVTAVAMGAYMAAPGTLTGAGEPVRLGAEEVTSTYFDTLGIAPAQGRTSTRSTTRKGNRASSSCRTRCGRIASAWRRSRRPHDHDQPGGLRSRRDHAARVPRRESVSHRHAGATSGFRRGSPPSSWPTATITRCTSSPGSRPAIGRRRSTTSCGGIAAGFGPAQAGGAVSVGAASLQADVIRDVSALLLFLLGAVALILLLACLNVAGLLVVRSLARRRDIAVRLALGATRQRVAGELLVQSLVLTSPARPRAGRSPSA